MERGDSETAGADEVGRIELSWADPSLRLVAHLTGPGQDADTRFHIDSSPECRTPGSLSKPPFAAVIHRGRTQATIQVAHVRRGVYRYSVAVPGGDPAVLARSGAVVRVVPPTGPSAVFPVPEGCGSRWTVFDARIAAGGIRLDERRMLAAGPAGDTAEAWSPPPGDPEATTERPACPVCGEPRDFAVVLLKHVYHYRRCRRCGVLSAAPLPSPDELLARLASWGERAPYPTPEEQEAAIRAVEHRLEWIRRERPGARRLLDMGAGAGAFLAAARRAGLEPTGVEIVPGTARFPGVDIVVGNLPTLDLPLRAWDVVTLWDSVEHLLDPVGMLRHAVALLRDDGILVVETPNERGASARIRGARWWVFGPTDHFVLFSPATLTSVVGTAGGRMLRVESRMLCPWDEPGTRPPTGPWATRLRRLWLSYPAAVAAGRLGLGDWVLGIAAPHGRR